MDDIIEDLVQYLIEFGKQHNKPLFRYESVETIYNEDPNGNFRVDWSVEVLRLYSSRYKYPNYRLLSLSDPNLVSILEEALLNDS